MDGIVDRARTGIQWRDLFRKMELLEDAGFTETADLLGGRTVRFSHTQEHAEWLRYA